MINRTPKTEVRSRALNYFKLLCKLAEERNDPYPSLRSSEFSNNELVAFVIEGRGSLKGVNQYFDNLGKEDISLIVEDVMSDEEAASDEDSQSDLSR